LILGTNSKVLGQLALVGLHCAFDDPPLRFLRQAQSMEIPQTTAL